MGQFEVGASVDTVGEGSTSLTPWPEPGHTDGGDDSSLDDTVPDAEELVSEAVALAGDDRDTARLVGRYWRFAPDEELIGASARAMLDAAVSHRELAEERTSGEPRVRITTAPGGHTVIEIVTDDMPFLVDSATVALSARHLDIHQLIHPVLVVRREPLGKLVEVRTDVEPDDADAADQLESWMRIEVDPVSDPAERDQLLAELRRVLTDVREAVEDWPKMHAKALAIADELAGGESRPPVPEKDITDSVDLLRWLADDHFTFLGYREYRLVAGDGGELQLQAVLGTGLGILRQDQVKPRPLSSMYPEAYARALEQRLLIITKANSRATVHRSAYLDYIGFKTFDENGAVSGERRFLGLFSAAAYRTSVRDLPVVRRKVHEVLDRSGLSPRSHSGKDLMEILETYPRDELFQIKTNDLYDAAIGVLRMAGRRQLRVFLRRDGYGRFISCLVYLPRDRFTTQNRLRMQEILLRELNGLGVDHTTRVTESLLARLHFTVRTDPANPPQEIDPDRLAEQLADATRMWEDDYRLVLERTVGDAQAKDLLTRYASALSDVYKDEHTPHEAVKDLAKLELLEEPGQLEMHVFRKRKSNADLRFKVFRYGEPMLLSAVLPVLHSLGVQVTDEHPYEVHRVDGTIYLYDFGLQLPAGARDLFEIRHHMQNAFSAAWRGEAEVDNFNELVLRAGLTWRQVVVLRAYAKYLRQTGTVFSQNYMEATFNAHPQIAEKLIALFENRFHPGPPLTHEDRALRSKELVAEITADLDGVTSLNQDRVLRSFLHLIQATLRTSFFQRTGDGRPKSYVAFKLDPQSIPDLPAPRPRYEIFVYSPRFEGVHLRFGPVARGGLRWSDRREDFRTEILGLVKAQMVKNAVIVPAGAKGGFVLKTSFPDRDALQAEGVACYRMFITALLDVTDNIVGGEVVPPADVVRHDADDPYLVVAADKGTATFSDTANEISMANGFWMGDAFASGGSAGYDHKKMGITARGAWESVKRHFRDMGVDTQRQSFTVVGIGDMSGDVFGNGMLLSRHIRLVAAFDHRHIFIDPDPEAETSYVERERLFRLPRSSWDDYDRKLISPGGGVYPRSAKTIPVSPAARRALGIPDPDDPDADLPMAPSELMRAVLLAPVDLLWNGGIGTYVKASTETHADAGDKSNDAIRVNGGQLRVTVVGEGGNLGFTQRGRVEYALRGGRLVTDRAGNEERQARIFTDFIDNSAGVDCSDHEVNIKILLGGAVADGELSIEDRDALLVRMTDEVAALVLRDNYLQATALSTARAQAHLLLPVHQRMIADLERAGRLDRELEGLPTDEELANRAVKYTAGLTPPEFAVLLAYVKIALEDEILASDLPDEDWTREVLANYFPEPLREPYADRMRGHRLHREIVTTVLVNEVVNRGGTSWVYRAMEETGANAADVLRAYVVVREVFGFRAFWQAVEGLDGATPDPDGGGPVRAGAQTEMYLKARRLLDRAVRWLVSSRRTPMAVEAEIARLKPGVQRLLPELERHFVGAERESLRASTEALADTGVPAEVADWTMRLMYGFGLLDIVEIANQRGLDVAEVAGVYFMLADHFRVDALLSKISALPRDDRWDTMARMALRYDLYAAIAALTAEVLEEVPAGDPAERVTAWERENLAATTRMRNALRDFADSDADLAALSVLLRQIRTLVRTTTS